MIQDYTRLSTPIFCLLVAALAGVIAWTGDRLPETLRLLLVLIALIFGITGVITMFDWLTHHAAMRVREMKSATVYPVLQVANAIKGLSPSQVDAVMRFDRTEIDMIIGDESPVFMVRCLVKSVPWTFVEEYLQKSKDTEGYLYPVRDMGNKDYASEVARLIIAKGWAEQWVGPFPAKLKIPLEQIAERFGVEL